MASPDVANRQIDTGKPYPIKAAWIQTTNSIACMGSQPSHLYDQLKGLDFVAGCDVYHDANAAGLRRRSDAGAMWPEEEQLVDHPELPGVGHQKGHRTAGRGMVRL